MTGFSDSSPPITTPVSLAKCADLMRLCRWTVTHRSDLTSELGETTTVPSSSHRDRRVSNSILHNAQFLFQFPQTPYCKRSLAFIFIMFQFPLYCTLASVSQPKTNMTFQAGIR